MPTFSLRSTVDMVRIHDAGAPRRLARALGDLWTGLVSWRLPVSLARLDLRNRYRGSVLGPLWLTLSTAVMITALGILYSTLFKLPVQDYLPYLAVSLMVWNSIAQMVAEGCQCFIQSENIIRQLPLPFTTHALRCVLRNALVAAHNLPLILVVFLVAGHLPDARALLALPGLLLLCVNSLAVAILLGMLCARFRDIPPIVANVMQLAFFMSPVIWKPDALGPAADWLLLNPFFTVMETIRGPLLNAGFDWQVWVSALVYSALLWGVALALFVRFRSRIAFWV